MAVVRRQGKSRRGSFLSRHHYSHALCRRPPFHLTYLHTTKASMLLLRLDLGFAQNTSGKNILSWL